MSLPISPDRPSPDQWDSSWPLHHCRADLLWRLRLLCLEAVIEAAWVHGDHAYVAFPGRHLSRALAQTVWRSIRADSAAPAPPLVDYKDDFEL